MINSSVQHNHGQLISSQGTRLSLTYFIAFATCSLIVVFMMVFADLAQAQSPATAIGQVETLRGNATATRTNAVVSKLSIGDPVFSGDTIQTGPASTLGITFLDQTVFSISENATMVVDDLVYNPQAATGNMAINLVKGTFVFLAGRIAPTGNMKIDTPVAQIGIRGTLPWVTVGDATSFAILTERDGRTGEYVLIRKGTNIEIGTVNLATVGTRQKLVMNSPADVPRVVDKTPEELAAEQRFKTQIFDTLTTRDTRLGIAPGQNQGPPPGNQGGNNPPPGNPDGNNPPPGDQGSIPGNDATNAALIDQATAVVAACTQAQTKINYALQRYHQGAHRQSQQLLQEAQSDIRKLPPQSCDTLLDRITRGQQAIDRAENDGRNAQAAINSCNENEINRLRGSYASSHQKSARAILANLDQAAANCARRRIEEGRKQQKAQANAECRRLNGAGYYAGKVRADGSFSCRPTKRTANAWCRKKNGRGSIAGRVKANGTFNCHYSRKERSRQAWAACRRQHGSRLVNVKIFNSGRYRCIVRNVVRRQPPPPPPRREPPPQQQHDPATSAAVIGGILGAIEGIGNRHRKSRSRRNEVPRHSKQRSHGQNEFRPQRLPRRSIGDHCKYQSIGGC